MVTMEQAVIQWNQSQAIYQLVMAGFSHESARDAINNNDLSKLEKNKSEGQHPGEIK